MSSPEILIFVSCTVLGWLILRRYRQPILVTHEPNETCVRSDAWEIEPTGPLSRFDRWFGRVIRCGRIPCEPPIVALLLGGLAIVTAATVFVGTERGLLAFWAAVLTLLISLVGVYVAYLRIIAQFEQQLPLALDLMARAVSAGESLDQAICLVSESLEEPARTEFHRCHNQLAMGLSVRAAMDSMAERVDTLNVRIMGSILAVHRETGGNLAETLHRLARVVRKRFEYQRRLRTVTGAGRVSLLIVVTLAWGLFAYLFVRQPDYGKQFFESTTGTKMLSVAVVLEVVGVIWGWMLLKQKY